jgi:hypothetical protein
MHRDRMAGWRRSAVASAVAALFFDPLCVEANAGVPMIFVTLPGMAIALVPIVLVEALVLARSLKAEWWSCANLSLMANLASSFLGLPLTWLMLVVIQMLSGGDEAFGLDSPWHRFLAVTWQAPWLIPYENDLPWMVPSAALVLLMPFFVVSVAMEYYVVRRMLPGATRRVVRTGVLVANAWSYTGLAAVLVVILALRKP